MNKLFSALVLLFAMSGLTGAYAQAPSSTGPTPGSPVTNSPTAVPLDGGASLLLASGVALGVRHLRQRRKAQH